MTGLSRRKYRYSHTIAPMSANGFRARRNRGTWTTLAPAATASLSSEPSRSAVSPVSSTASNSGDACAVRIVTCRAGPPMFMRVMTRASLGGAVVGNNPPQSLREADRGSVSDRLLGEQDVGEGVLDVALARRPMHGSQGTPVQP